MLGMLNHTILTLEAAERRGLHVAGVILNETQPFGGTAAEETNPGELERWIRAPILAVVRHHLRPMEERLEVLSGIEWQQLSEPRRESSCKQET
jgi:dethiobiotin synthetase